MNTPWSGLGGLSTEDWRALLVAVIALANALVAVISWWLHHHTKNGG